MDRSRPARSTEPECSAVVFIDMSGNECQYPQVQRDRMPVPCPMEHCGWVGEAQLCEEHSKEKHSPYTVQPTEYHTATHMLIPKEDIEKVDSLQEEAGKLTLAVTDRKKKLELCEKEVKEKKREVKKTREELHECEDRLQCCVNQIHTLHSQNTRKADPVIPQRSEMANQQSGTGGANSTASLGRASQPQPPPQERCSTLDAKDSDYQQFKDMIELEEEDLELMYGKPEPQTKQEQRKEALAVGSKQSYPLAELDGRPPLPPKPKTSQNSSSNSDVPPELPPKPQSKSSPKRSQQIPKDLSGPGDAEQPPPLPPKPGQAAQAVVPLQRRARRSPTPASTTSHSTAARADGDYCSNCHQLQEQNAQLQENCSQIQEKNDRLTCLLKKQIFAGSSNTCPPAPFRDSKPSYSRFRSPTF